MASPLSDLGFWAGRHDREQPLPASGHGPIPICPDAPGDPLSCRCLCHLRADCPARATVPAAVISVEVSLTATSIAMMARTAVTGAIGVRTLRRSRCPLGCDPARGMAAFV